MAVSPPRLAPHSRLRFPRRTARLRLTALCGGLFLLSGAALVAITYGLFERATAFKSPRLPKIPQVPAAVADLQLPPPLVQAQKQLALTQQFLSQTKHQLAGAGAPHILLPNQLTQDQSQLTQAQHQLANDQHQLASAVNQVGQAVHQLAQSGSSEVVQRAADSHQLLVNSGIALAIVAVLALLAGWLVAGRMLRPIRTITRTARKISSTNLGERLALDGPEDELKELGDTLDDLFGRLDAAFDAQRHFVANASHELRTPLTVERTLLQVALDDPDTTSAAWRSTAEEVLASNDEQARLIEALLTLASSESGRNEHEPVDLATIVDAALVDLQPEIDRRGIHIDKTIEASPLDGEALLVERLVANLLGNAVRHNVDEGRLEVATKLEDGKAVLSVTNTGARIPPAEIDRLFQPFQRLEQRRGHYKDGYGLGLSIVRAIASAHQASLRADPMPDGGLSVRVIFPETTTPAHESETASMFPGERESAEASARS
jgi:signal transduction histidine kinase